MRAACSKPWTKFFRHRSDAQPRGVDRVNDPIDHGRFNRQFYSHLGHEAFPIFRAATSLGVFPLATMSLDITGRDAVDTDLAQGLLDLFVFERLNHCRHEPHAIAQPINQKLNKYHANRLS
jgi:hypothetical protein